MILFGYDLPEPVAANTHKAIEIARNIHQEEVDSRVRNTQMQKWDRYWVKIYDIILTQLKEA